MTDEEPWIASFLAGLADLADLQRQRRAWVLQDGTLVADPAELVSQVFDDSAVGDELDAGRAVFSPSADARLRELDALIDVVDLALLGPRAALLADPRWTNVTRAAGRALTEVRTALGRH